MPVPQLENPAGLPLPNPFPSLPLPRTGVPAILVKLFAEAFNVAVSSKGLLIELQDERVLEAGILFVTWIGRSKIVYKSVLFSRKFCRIEICFYQHLSTFPGIITNIVCSSRRWVIVRYSIPNQAVRPNPIYMLHGTSWFLIHYFSHRHISSACCQCSAVWDCEIVASRIAREEHRNVVYRRYRMGGIRREADLPIGSHIESNLQKV